MSVLDQLAWALGRRDETPNQELARRLAETDDTDGVAELAANLWNRDRNIAADCIKTLYEVGYIKPELITPHALMLIKLLHSRNNRMVWGGMISLSTIGHMAADVLFPHVGDIQQAMQTGSVITVDGGVLTLAGIASANREYNTAIFPYLLKHLQTCRPKDLPQHAEKTLRAVNEDNRDAFIAVIQQRLDIMTASQAARLKKVIRQAECAG